MARAVNPLTRGLSGKISNIVFRQRRGGKLPVVAAAPSPHATTTPGATANRDHFRHCVAYANAAAADPAGQAYYTPFRKPGQGLYHVALGDARKAPVIHTVDLTAARHPTAPHVRIHATDNIGVIAVEIELFHPDGTRLHHLPAVLDPRQWWRADLPADLPADCRLVVTARDRPANRTRAEHLLP